MSDNFQKSIKDVQSNWYKLSIINTEELDTIKQLTDKSEKQLYNNKVDELSNKVDDMTRDTIRLRDELNEMVAIVKDVKNDIATFKMINKQHNIREVRRLHDDKRDNYTTSASFNLAPSYSTVYHNLLSINKNKRTINLTHPEEE